MTVAKIDRMQYFFMIPNLLFGKAIGITAGVMVRKLGNDTWISMLIGFVIGTGIILLMTYLCSAFSGKSTVEISEDIFGKWIGKGINILLILFFVMAYGASANVMTLHITEYFLPETPFFMICILYTFLCLFGVYKGVEVVVRFSFVGFVMSVLINLAMFIGTSGDIRIIELFPLMNKGLLSNIAGSTYIFGDISLAILAVGFLYPMLNKKKKVFSITFWAMVTSVCLIIIWPIYEITVLGPELMSQYAVVCMQQIRCAQLTQYLPRFELIMVSFFTFGVFVQSTAMFYCANYCIKKLTNIKKDWMIFLPMTLILILVTYFMGADDNDFINFLAFPYSQICAVMGIGLPVVLFFTALFRGKLKKQKKSA